MLHLHSRCKSLTRSLKDDGIYPVWQRSGIDRKMIIARLEIGIEDANRSTAKHIENGKRCQTGFSKRIVKLATFAHRVRCNRRKKNTALFAIKSIASSRTNSEQLKMSRIERCHYWLC